MTTAQTGGGNGAAPDGERGRIMPDRAGWWYAQWAHDEPSDDMTFIASVLRDEHRLFVHLGGVTSDLRAFRWLAPIPGPAVLAALAEWAEAHELDCTEAGHQDRFWDAEIALADALRAERDGAA